MHGDSGRQLRVRVSCRISADTSALLACDIGCVSGAATPVRGDIGADSSTDRRTYGHADSCTDGRTHRCTDGGTDGYTNGDTDGRTDHSSLRCRHSLLLAQHGERRSRRGMHSYGRR